MKARRIFFGVLMAAGLSGVSGAANQPGQYSAPYKTDAFASTYVPRASHVTLIKNATLLTGTGAQLDYASVLMAEGKIMAVGENLEAPEGAVIIDGTGKWVTPGIIDVHSHLGAEASPREAMPSNTNEKTSPITAEVWVEHSVWPQDPGFSRALLGGVTTLQILPGSANLIGGRGVVLKNIPSVTRSGMKFLGAPHSLKMACGENPLSIYGKKSGPATRMAMMAGYRKAWIEAVAYKKSWDRYETARNAGEKAQEPKRDLKLDTLAGVLAGNILVHNHCYRADEMASMIELSHEFGYKISSFHHAVEAYKIPDLLAKEGTCASMWADWWGFKMEAFDAIDENVPMVAAAGACAIVHSDSPLNVQRLNIDTARAWADGRAVGLNFSKGEAFRWLTMNPAIALGIADQTGSLEAGKMADVVLWDGDPFDIYTAVATVFIDGAIIYDRQNPETFWQSDFETGLNAKGIYQ